MNPAPEGSVDDATADTDRCPTCGEINGPCAGAPPPDVPGAPGAVTLTPMMHAELAAIDSPSFDAFDTTPQPPLDPPPVFVQLPLDDVEGDTPVDELLAFAPVFEQRETCAVCGATALVAELASLGWCEDGGDGSYCPACVAPLKAAVRTRRPFMLELECDDDEDDCR